VLAQERVVATSSLAEKIEETIKQVVYEHPADHSSEFITGYLNEIHALEARVGSNSRKATGLLRQFTSFLASKDISINECTERRDAIQQAYEDVREPHGGRFGFCWKTVQ